MLKQNCNIFLGGVDRFDPNYFIFWSWDDLKHSFNIDIYRLMADFMICRAARLESPRESRGFCGLQRIKVWAGPTTLSSSIDFWSLKTHFEVTLKSPFAVPSRLGSLIETLINHHGAETLAWWDVTCFFPLSGSSNIAMETSQWGRFTHLPMIYPWFTHCFTELETFFSLPFFLVTRIPSKRRTYSRCSVCFQSEYCTWIAKKSLVIAVPGTWTCWIWLVNITPRTVGFIL